MTPERWSELQAIFASALETPAEERDARVRALCRGDDELVREVSSLLTADAEASAMIRAPMPSSMIPARENPVPVGLQVGEYIIQSLLGRGGMGVVYAGIHPLIGKEVAIKVLDARMASNDGIVERFVREARAVNTIRHPNIIDIFAFGRSPELGHYFVMPRLVGETLGARVERQPLSLAELLPIVDQIADALDAAHRAGVLHRDLKPDNIFLVADRRGGVTVQILDFGIAKLLDGSTAGGGDASVTRSGVQMGTPLFMSPEQWEAGAVDQRTDVYALGVMVHHALTGRYPFESSSPVALMNMHANRPPTPASEHGAPPAVDRVIARALAKSPEHRPGTARVFHAELAAVGPLAGSAAPASPPSAPGTAITTLSGSATGGAPLTSSRGRRLAAVGGLLTIGALVAVAAITLGRRDVTSTTGAADDPARDAERVGPQDTAASSSPPVIADAWSPPLLPDAGVRRSRPTPDARTAPRATVDAGVALRDAVAPTSGTGSTTDASEWGTTINPFPRQP